ncbi:DUF5134 domain-containing protein [Streptomyces fuscichromogenes]|uniref:DUF5134 domain-containing protein n=1 Tax=Streptomyces fuscichromogenes TaxID=1324013 RepID=UPI003830A980
MSATEAVHCMLTALFAVAAVRMLRQAVVTWTRGRRGRVDRLLHAAMALAMAVMPWHWAGAVPELPQSVFFAGAALWFPLTAVRSGQERRSAATARRLPYAVGMAAMTWMSYRAADHAHLTMAEGVPAAQQAMYLGHSMGGSRTDSAVTGVLALYLLACSLRSLTRGMPVLRGSAEVSDDSTSLADAWDGFWDGMMALGTVVMLLMPH